LALAQKVNKNNTKIDAVSVDDLKENLTKTEHKIRTLKKCNYGLIAAFFVVLVLGVISVSVLVGFWQNYSKITNQNKQMFLSDVSLEVTENKSNNISVAVLYNTLTGVGYTQNVKLDFSKLKSDQVVRGKLTLTKASGETINIPLTEHDNWKLGDDGYLYYCGLVNNESELFLCEQVELQNGVLNVENNSNMHYLTFTIESLNYNSGVANIIWSQAPQNWLKTV
jgi:hypothetical protein